MELWFARRAGVGRLCADLVASEFEQPAFEICPARITALLVGHPADRRQGRAPVRARHRFAHLPLVELVVISRIGHGGQATRGFWLVRRHRPQCDLVLHAAAIGFSEGQRLRILRQLHLGCQRDRFAQPCEPLRCNPAAARRLRPAQRTLVDRLHERRVVAGQRQVLRRQALRCCTHHAWIPFCGGLVDPLPAQRRRQAAFRGQHCERRIAFGWQRLAGASPDRLRIADPLRVGRTRGLACVQFGAAQDRAPDRGRPRGAERQPVLPPRGRCQPEFAERPPDGFAFMTLEKRHCRGARHRVDVAPELREFEPRIERMARQAYGLDRIELAALGRLERRADLRVWFRWGGCDGGAGNQGQGADEGKQSNSWRHEDDYNVAKMNGFPAIPGACAVAGGFGNEDACGRSLAVRSDAA